MPLIRVNQQDDGLALHRSPAPALAALRHAARQGGGAQNAPVIVMVHGFKFRPGDAADCPHTHIFAPEDAQCWKAVSWPRALGLSEERGDDALGIAFGWHSKGMIWNAYGAAARAGEDLARAIRAVRAAAPGRPVHAIAHSLGARVVLQALPHLAAGDLGRIIALNPAEFRSPAEAALATPAGRAAELIAVTGRENAVYDLMLERLVQPERRGDRALGWGLPEGPGRLMLRLDRPAVVAHLDRLGFPLAPRRRLMCHWSPYLREGAMTLYAALMRQAQRLPLEALAVPERQTVRPDPAPGLPWGSGAPS